MDNKVKGYILAALSAATYGMNPLFAIPLYDSGMDANSVLFFRYLLAIPLIGTMLKIRGRSFRLETGQWLPVIAMGLLIALSSLALFESYNHINSGIASTLLFVYPILVAMIMAIFFREKLPLTTWIYIGLAGVGIAMLCKSPGDKPLSPIGLTFVGLSALSYAIYMVGISTKRLKSIATLTMTFYTLAFGVALFLIPISINGHVATPAHWHQWANLLGLAVFPTAISFLCATAAIQYIGSTPTAILGALEPVTAIIFSVTLLNQPITPHDVIGMAIIIIAVTLVITGSKIAGPITKFKHMLPWTRKA